jgi:hypothetical protein
MAKKKAAKPAKSAKKAPARKAAVKKLAAKKAPARKAPPKKAMVARPAPAVIRKATPVAACACPAPAQADGLVLIGRVTVPGPRISISSAARR